MVELGTYSLLLALAFSLLAAGVSITAALSGRADWLRTGERGVYAVFALLSLAMLALETALLGDRFDLAFVAQVSSREQPWAFKIPALWGAQAGSLLLWCWMLGLFSAIAVWQNRNRNRVLMPWVIATLMANVAFFAALVCFVSNPFELLSPVQAFSNGRGLNPLLQHPAMLIHPPILYTGFVGFAVPFAFALAALVTGELGVGWFRTTRRWTITAWLFLGLGIMLGGRWAYEVLGWGGYWAWDPVENASFMPWLPATAYLHSVMIQEKRNMLKTWNLLLIGLTYSLCLFGTFLTRSGIVQSVHAFAQTPIFTSIFLGYVLVTAFGFLALLLWRRDQIRSPARLESMVSREASFLLNNWVFMAILMVVFWGTLFPVFSEAITGERIAVGPSFFNTMAGPLALFLLFLTGVGPLVAWRRASLASLRKQFVWPATAGVATGAAFTAYFRGSVEFYPLMVWALGAFVTGTVVQEYTRAIRTRVMSHGESPPRALATLLRKNQQRYGGYIVHLGVVFFLIGTAGSVFNEERLENVSPGQEVAMNGYRLRYLTALPLPAQHYGGAVARLALYRKDEPVAVMTPEKRIYWLEEQPVSIPSVYSTLREDFYVILTAIEADGSATLKIYRNPLVNWIWIGGAIFVLGTLVVMWPHPQRPPRE